MNQEGCETSIALRPLSLNHAAGSRRGSLGCFPTSARIQERWNQGWRWNMGIRAWPCSTPRVQVCNTGTTECFTGWWWKNSMNTPRCCWDLRQHHWCGHWGGGACSRPETKEEGLHPRQEAGSCWWWSWYPIWLRGCHGNQKQETALSPFLLPSIVLPESPGDKTWTKATRFPKPRKKDRSKIKAAGGQHTEKGNSNHPSYPTLPHCLLGSYTAKWLYISWLLLSSENSFEK